MAHAGLIANVVQTGLEFINLLILPSAEITGTFPACPTKAEVCGMKPDWFSAPNSSSLTVRFHRG